MINRKTELKTLQHLLKTFSVVGIIGARQVGKTTLAKMLAKTLKKQITYFDLENPEDLARLSDPMLTLKDIKRFSYPKRSGRLLFQIYLQI